VRIQPFDRDYARLLFPTLAALGAGVAVHLVLGGAAWPIDLVATGLAAAAVYFPVLLMAGLPAAERRTALRLGSALVGRRPH
jgi:hypothetical protein